MARLDAWKHCPRCTALLRHQNGRVECAECGFVEFANSKPTASAVIVDDEGRVMLSKRAIEPAAGKWDLPGGFLEEGEHPIECLHRELREEADVGLRDTEFIGVFMDWYETGQGRVSTLNLYWSARIADGTPVPQDDVEELRFFAAEEVPAADLAFAHIPDVLSTLRRRDEDA